MKKSLSKALLITPFFAAFMLGCGGDEESGVQPSNCSNPPKLTIAASQNPTCGASNGSLQVSGSGGSGTLTYSLNSGTFQSSNTFGSLAAGSYEITVKDANGCTTKQSFSLSSGSSNLDLTLSVSKKPDCKTANGTLSATSTGGSGGYTFSLNGGVFQTSNRFTVGEGTFEITVKDSEGCTFKKTTTVGTNISLAADIKPIITANCAISAGCHGAGASGRPIFTSNDVIIANANSIKTRTANGTMPPNGKLPQELIDKIACWVDSGAQNN